MMKNHNMSLLALLLSGMLALTGCGGDDGKDGVDGANGANGVDGTDGADGKDGVNAGEFVSTVYKAGDVSFTIDAAENTLAGSDAFVLKFSVAATNQVGDAKPLTGLEEIRVYSATAVTNATQDGPSVYWQSNGSMYCTLTGMRGTAETCTLTEDPENPGSYTGTWEHDGAATIMSAADDLNAPHRIMLRVYGLTDENGVAISDKVLETFTYLPATGEMGVASGKDTVPDAVCKQCHGESDATGKLANIHAHHNYESVENCIQCHNPGTQPSAEEAAEGYVYDLPAMIHRIHGGEHLAALAPYGFIQAEEWAEIKYPAPLYECTVCHQGGDTWATEPTRAACTGCHSNIDFATGVGHSEFELAQADDSQCMACHTSGPLAPIQAHKVGKQAEYADLLKVNYTGATKAASVNPGYQVVTVTAEVTLNGAPLANVADLAVIKKTSTLMGNISATGEVTRWATRPNLTAGTLVNGVLELTQEVTDAQATGTIYLSGDMQYCVSSAGKAVSCADDDLSFGDDDWIGANIPTKFFNLDGGTATPSRYVVEDTITIAQDKCNACHSDMNYVKRGHHGVHNIDQCMDCHNNNYPGAHNGFDNKDLATSVHYYHSNDVVPYPGPADDCTMCHKDGDALFRDDGTLTSGRKAIQVPNGYISPVSESCHACHISEAAVAHFKSNGAYVLGSEAETSALPVESCATCHAEGKSFGIDKFHKM
ncbi:OmcA/MtrC family decaheme c-type cytochrome [Shewanella avicenniae]|uniref:OmcA/MtrC family decaheme c-type cytochrome n=1 Tax=Shewanella avicenniae TaxID=2814294 RepID=A0ABX7QSV6_9GAMM|nr:OmcA/MtrC family decaheme c-type cytochrome [Shewanella avicenniae]QSX34561.1 OmcA/MtrC family decaheme c-type cytochrome [Shewanella avicenniae]